MTEERPTKGDLWCDLRLSTANAEFDKMRRRWHRTLEKREWGSSKSRERVKCFWLGWSVLCRHSANFNLLWHAVARLYCLRWRLAATYRGGSWEAKGDCRALVEERKAWALNEGRAAAAAAASVAGHTHAMTRAWQALNIKSDRRPIKSHLRLKARVVGFWPRCMTMASTCPGTV